MENNLQLQGASWMAARNDEYVKYIRIKAGESEKDICKNTPGYDDPCPTDGANRVFSLTIIYVIITSIFTALIMI